MLSEF
jgi:hypothetical protein